MQNNSIDRRIIAQLLELLRELLAASPRPLSIYAFGNQILGTLLARKRHHVALIVFCRPFAPLPASLSNSNLKRHLLQLANRLTNDRGRREEAVLCFYLGSGGRAKLDERRSIGLNSKARNGRITLELDYQQIYGLERCWRCVSGYVYCAAGLFQKSKLATTS